MKFFQMIGLAPSERDQKLRLLVSNSYPSVKVVGRGTVKIDAKEVKESPEFQSARDKAKAIVAP